MLLLSSGHLIRVLAAPWIGLEPSWRWNSFALGTASLSAFGYDLDLSRPVIELRNGLHQVSAAVVSTLEAKGTDQ